jgi:RNA polymerase sigma-70 factor, ECF subfamily
MIATLRTGHIGFPVANSNKLFGKSNMSQNLRSNLEMRKPSFESVVMTELPVLYRVAKRLVRSEADAEDLVGQCLLLAAKAWDQFDGRHPRSWLIRILKNEHLGRIRSRANKQETAIDDIAEPSEEGFWEEISWRAVGQDIMTELDKIPEEYRMAVVLCDIEEMSYEDAAIAMDCAVGTVRSRLFRGRRILRSRLAKALGIESEETNGGLA